MKDYFKNKYVRLFACNIIVPMIIFFIVVIMSSNKGNDGDGLGIFEIMMLLIYWIGSLVYFFSSIVADLSKRQLLSNNISATFALLNGVLLALEIYFAGFK